MPLYYFHLHDSKGLSSDPDGTMLADDVAARAHARRVAQELMQHRELKTRHWKLQVCDMAGEVVFETLFASVDHTLDQLDPELRASLEQLSRSIGGLVVAISDCRMTIMQSHALLARAEGKPYLATVDGRRI